MHRVAGALAMALACAVFATAERAAPPTSRVVQIDVFAADARGRTVDNLTLADFEVREDGVPQSVEGVRFVRVRPVQEVAAPIVVRSVADERQAAAPEESRLFAIFLDENHVSAGASTERARGALTRFIDRDVTARDLVVVMKPLDSLFAIRFSGDRDAARQSIHDFGGRKGEYDARNAYERNFIAGTPARIDAARNQVAWSAINALAVHMGGLTDRRKTLIVVSEGIAAAERRRGQEYLPTRDTVVRSANRSNVAVYTVDPREPGAIDADAAADAVRSLAADTDGETISADLDAGLQRAAAQSSAYYLVRYTSAHSDDGRFHQVQLLSKRSGVQLRARKGFTAASPDEVLRAELLKELSEPKPVAPPEPSPHVSTLIHPWFGIARGPAHRSRVTFVWEPAARVPGDRDVRRNPARVLMKALAADGTVLFDGPVLATGPAMIDEPGAVPARAVFDAPPGRLRLRMSIQDVTAQVLDVDVRELSVRELKGDVAVGTPEVLRARNAREFRSLETDSAVPVASREFSRTERLLVRFQAYGPTGAEPLVSARLLTRMGQAMRDLAVAPAASGEAEHAIDLSLASLATGEYIIEVEAKGPAGDVKDRVGFRVTP
jgi:VWFA-related protein